MTDLLTFNVSFTIRATERIVIPYYAGFTLRGIFGHALREISCTEKTADCRFCSRRTECAYAEIFETEPGAIPNADKLADFPRPYVINPSPPRHGGLRQGENYRFDIVLVGSAVKYLLWVIRAFEKAGQMEMGGPRISYRVVGVDVVGSDGFRAQFSDGELKMLPSALPSVKASSLNKCENIKLLFVTPLRLKVQKQVLSSPPPFGMLIHAIARRVELYQLAAGQSAPVLTQELQKQSQEIRIAGSDLLWVNLARYSNRQNTRMKQDGLVGSIAYTGQIAPFIPILKIGERINVGKSTVFGLGRYVMEL